MTSVGCGSASGKNKNHHDLFHVISWSGRIVVLLHVVLLLALKIEFLNEEDKSLLTSLLKMF